MNRKNLLAALLAAAALVAAPAAALAAQPTGAQPTSAEPSSAEPSSGTTPSGSATPSSAPLGANTITVYPAVGRVGEQIHVKVTCAVPLDADDTASWPRSDALVPLRQLTFDGEFAGEVRQTTTPGQYDVIGSCPDSGWTGIGGLTVLPSGEDPAPSAQVPAPAPVKAQVPVKPKGAPETGGGATA
ncbi:hypothetical protein [Umezawaea beigongshangensis]|uniref:hypothetical protein n=1 Tax=Umezawaea beigongshangensis TaxID=2780383 RepID=UPI0018F11695|nr:hypothetical protein [Umezawaea beigongshangensis]